MKNQEQSSANTKGPWYLTDPCDVYIDRDVVVKGIVVMKDDPEVSPLPYPIARVTGPSYFGSEDSCDPELIANARLIAKSWLIPELLEVCEMLLDTICTLADGDICAKEVSRAERVLAKADWRTPP